MQIDFLKSSYTLCVVFLANVHGNECMRVYIQEKHPVIWCILSKGLLWLST